MPVWQEGSLLEVGHSGSHEAGSSLLGKGGNYQQATMMGLCCFHILDMYLVTFTPPEDA